MTTIKYKTTLGETIEYPKPAPDVAKFLARIEEAAEDPRVREDAMIALVYSTENPILEQGKFEGRGAVTKAVLANPLYRVLLDLLEHKRVALGKVTPDQLGAAFTMTVAEAARELDITPDAVLRAIRAKRIAAVKKPTGYLADPRSVQSYRETRARGGMERAPDLRIVFGSAPGKSWRVRFDDLAIESSQERKDGTKLKIGSVASFVGKGAICFSETKRDGTKLNRFFLIEPARRVSRYPTEGGPFYVEGLFRVAETENDPQKAAKAFAAFGKPGRLSNTGRAF
jgi:hypothetical protein